MITFGLLMLAVSGISLFFYFIGVLIRMLKWMFFPWKH